MSSVQELYEFVVQHGQRRDEGEAWRSELYLETKAWRDFPPVPALTAWAHGVLTIRNLTTRLNEPVRARDVEMLFIYAREVAGVES